MARLTQVVCVSHLTGAEGEAIARGAANRLGFRYLDEEIIETAAEWSGLAPSVVGEVERRKSLMRRIGEAIGTDPMPTRPDAAVERRSGTADPREKPSDEELRALIRDVIREIAEDGNLVIASHAAAMVLTHREDILRVLVTASPKTRASRVASAENVEQRPAEKLVADADASRVDYLKRFHGIDRELPIHYDLVVNTDDLSPELGAELVARAAEPT
jgi:cytidylate kinase